LFPGAIAALWKLAAALGVDSSMALVMLARLILVAASIVTIWFAARIATAALGPRAGAAVAVILMAFPPSVAFAYRAMSETASAPLLVIGVWYFTKRSQHNLALAGLALSLACLLRYQNGLIVLVMLPALLLQRRWREALSFCAAGLGTALLGGLLDWATWGRPFHSLIAYFDFNLLRAGASSFGIEPFSYYATTLWSSAGPSCLVLLACFAYGSAFQPVVALAVVCYVLAHSVLPHKELRFLVPCLPLFAAVAGIGAERLLRKLPKPNAIAAVSALVLTAAFALRLINLTYEDMGQYQGTERASLPVWKSEQEPTLLLADASKRPDLCGIELVGARAAFTGGYTYLHRDVPLIYGEQVCDTAPVNYIIGPIGRALPGAYRLEQERGSWGLFRRDGTCDVQHSDDDQWLEGARDMGLVRRKAQQSSDGTLRFDLQRDAGAFVEGWGHGELLACEGARWSVGKRSAIEFDFTPSDRAYQLIVRASAFGGANPQRFAVAINGQVVHGGPLKSNLDTYAMDVPDGALQDGANRIDLLFTRAERGSSNDPRELSALFRGIEIVPQKDDFSIDLALREAGESLGRGFSAIEKEADLSFAWSDGPASEVEGSLANPRQAYVLTIIAEAVPFVRSQEARVFVNDAPVGYITFPSEWGTRELVIPRMLLQRGKNKVRFEYAATARPARVIRSLGDQRELGVRFRRIELVPLTAPSELDMGTPTARPFLLDGWSEDEVEGERNTVWSNALGSSALLSLEGVQNPVLRLSAEGYGSALPINVSVSLNGKQVGAFAAPDGWQNISIPLPVKGAGGGELVRFDFDRTGRPSDHNPGSADHRDLALRVDRMWIESEAQSQALSAAVSALHSDMR
jgi:hypothetical protein